MENGITHQMIHSRTTLSSRPDTHNEIDQLVETKKPDLYRVILLNDDYTPMDFVIFVLKNFFAHDDKTAYQIMMDVHKKGSGVAGVYSFEVAETKCFQANQFAQKNKYPLKTIIEKESDSAGG